MTALVLEIDRLSIRFGGLVAVDDVSFSIARNEIVGLIGPNGAGKTTIFNSICGVIKPDDGRIRLDGRDITGLTAPLIARAGISRTFQNIRQFGELSLRENVMMGAYRSWNCSLFASMLRLPVHSRHERMAADRAERWLGELNLLSYADQAMTALPFGLQRIAELARAMAGKPRLLLLDEPAAGLNPIEKKQLSNMLRRIVVEAGCSLLLVEHDMTMVMNLVDRAVVVNFGRKIADGTPPEVGRDAAVMKAYLGA